MAIGEPLPRPTLRDQRQDLVFSINSQQEFLNLLEVLEQRLSAIETQAGDFEARINVLENP